MDFTQAFRDPTQARRLRQSILLMIIVATLPCYCVGALLLGIAPDDETASQDNTPQTRTTSTAQSLPINDILNQTPSPTGFQIIFPTSNASPTGFIPIGPTPRQINPPPVATRAPTLTLVPPTPTPTPTLANQTPVFDQPADASVVVGSSTTVTLSFSDPDNDILVFQATSANSAIATVTPINATQFNVTGVAVGTTTVLIAVTDNKPNGSISRQINVTVTTPPPPNQPPQFDTPPPSSLTVDVGATQTLTFTFSDPDGDPVNLIVLSTDPTITVAQPSADTITVTGVSEGNATINLTLRDSNNNSISHTIAVTVQAVAVINNPPTFTTLPPSTYTITQGDSDIFIVEYTDPEGDSVTLTVSTNPIGIITTTVQTPTSFTILADVVGTTTMTIQLDDGQGNNTTHNVTVTVTSP